MYNGMHCRARYMFREEAVTYSTAEDFQLSAMLQKHANIPTFLFPMDKEDNSSFLYSKDFLEIVKSVSEWMGSKLEANRRGAQDLPPS